ncbi:MAG: GNAT family N-acetyltransferase [Lachnospiraceae bacterium]
MKVLGQSMKNRAKLLFVISKEERRIVEQIKIEEYEEWTIYFDAFICIEEKEIKQFFEQEKEKFLYLVLTSDKNIFEFLESIEIGCVGLATSCEQMFWGVKYVIDTLENFDYKYLLNIWKRFNKIPWTIAETKRCMIRESTLDDISDFFEIYRKKEMTLYIENLFMEHKDVKEYLKNYINTAYAFYGFGTWSIVDKKTNKVIGRAGFNMREECCVPELGFLIDLEYQRQGIGEEVCLAIVEIGFKEYEFHSIQALVDEENKSSLSLCKRIGLLEVEKVFVDNKEYIRLEKKNSIIY